MEIRIGKKYKSKCNQVVEYDDFRDDKCDYLKEKEIVTVSYMIPGTIVFSRAYTADCSVPVGQFRLTFEEE